MSLRNSPRSTPELLAAARRNAQCSTGPRSPAGKQRMKMNALKHGAYAVPKNQRAVMQALGEDPEEFEALRRRLMTTYGPADALWDQQLDDLAMLYWRRERVQRMETGLMRRALQALEERQRERGKAVAAATFDSSQSEAIDIDLGEPTDPCVRLRMLLSLLGVIRKQVRQRVFKPRQKFVIETYYRGETGWRQARFRYLLWLFTERLKLEERQDEEELKDFVKENFGPGESAVEERRQELLRLLDEEIADVEEEFEHEVEVQEEEAAIDRDACLAPAGETWDMLLRQEAALDRSIDRMVRIILALRKEHTRLLNLAAHPPADESNDQEAEELNQLLGFEVPSEGPPADDLTEILKTAEQSANVPENKEPVAEGVSL